jgi:diamine N-acetyltransferase
MIQIRIATAADTERISNIAIQTFVETYSWYNSPENMRSYTGLHFSTEQTRLELDESTTCFFLAFESEIPVGYAKMRVLECPEEIKDKKHIEVERIYVLKKYQNRNIGYALMNQCINHARTHAFEILWLGVWEKNQRAIDFYIRMGFTPFGTHIFQLGNDPQCDYLMKLLL